METYLRIFRVSGSNPGEVPSLFSRFVKDAFLKIASLRTFYYMTIVLSEVDSER